MPRRSSNLLRLPGFSFRKPTLPPPALSTMVEQAPVGILVADMRAPGARIVFVNAAFETITGYSCSEAIGKNCRYLQGSDRLQPEVAVVRGALAAGAECNVRLRNYRKDGSLFWNDLRLVPIGGADRPPTHYVGYIRDVTEAVTTATHLEEITRRDRLTGCLNRDVLVEELATQTAVGRILLVKVDIARFHEINGGYGYDTGDALLRATAQRLQSLGADLTARVGNDQFALSFAIDADCDPADVIERLTQTLGARFALPGADLQVRFAIGFVTAPRGADAMTLVRQAGAALAESKESALRRPCEFAADRQADALNRIRLTAELQRGLLADEFIYHYQPQVELASGRIVGAEALVRWRHPLFGLQQPGRFIGLAEETGLILDIGVAGFREVARFAAGFNRDRAVPLCFSFNVSALELTGSDMVALASRVIRETGVDPGWLTLELTESLMAEDSAEMLSIFHQLRDLGVGLSIDDFGTGYSSLRYLERFPLTEIKIDRSFVSGLAHSAAKRVIVEAVIRLGAEMGVRIIAEGVEAETERKMLATMGCLYAQGHLFSPPLAAAEFSQFARRFASQDFDRRAPSD